MSTDTLSRRRTSDETKTMGYPRDRSLHDIFRTQATRRPRARAAVDHGRSLTYGELALRSDALAARLVETGVGAGDTVGVCGHRCLEALVAFLAIVKTGAAYVPLDDDTPPRRAQAMAEAAGLHTVVTLPGSACRVRRIRSHIAYENSQYSSATRFSGPPVAATDCAYIMFTSGTTGRPKPVAIPHRGIARLAFSDLVTQRPRPGDRVLHAYGLSSDASTIEIWPALLTGACVVLADREELLAPQALESLCVRERVTIAYLTTGVFHHIARTSPHALRTLRFVSAGGEAMDPDLTRAVLTACPDTIVVNFYGPTENSVVSTAAPVWDLPSGTTTIPIGRPLEHSCAIVVRPDGTPTDTGEEGELLVGGDGLALGYLGDPDLTAERFITTAGRRFYRTGDRAVRLPNGELDYRGRGDRQIKLRGHRVELDEIEARLRSYPQVGEAVVDLDEDLLIGYLTPADGGSAMPLDRIRRDLSDWLPAAVAPSRLIALDTFPVTSAGKVDRRQLRACHTAPTSLAVSDRHGGLIDTVAEIWHTVLRVRPAPGDDFYVLGGDSLLAAETVTRTLAALALDARHGSQLIHSLLQTPTLAGFANALEALTTGAPAPPVGIDFDAEATLGFTVPARHGPAPQCTDPRRVVVTGATGFVGAFLVDRLLRTTSAQIYCLVRSRDAATARHRVHTTLARFDLTPPGLERLVCVPADLASPCLGLAANEADELADSVDLIFHAAAQVNFVYPYHALRDTNVEGTRHILRLAAPRRVPVHFLSTIAVLAGFGTAGIHYVTEDQPLAHGDRLTMGYAESKWVAEKLLAQAAAAGIPVAVYRPYEITGDRRTGACNTETAICSLFKTIAETGVAPDIPLPMDFVPVDYLAAAIVHIATRRQATGRTYHLTNPRPARLADMLDRMRAAGYAIGLLPYHDWVRQLVRHVAANPTSATAPFVSLCVDRGNKSDISVKEMYFEGTFPDLDRRNLDRDLAGSGLTCPPVDAPLLDQYLQYFHTTGYLNRPVTKRLCLRTDEG